MLISTARRAVDGRFQHRAGNSLFGGVHHAVFALADANAHMGQAARFHNGAHIGKVQIDQVRHGNEVGNALNALAERIVGDAEGLGDAGALGDHRKQPVVGHDHEGIDIRLEALDAGLGVLHALTAFKHEGLGDHADGENAHIAGQFGDDGRRAGAGAAAHAAGDEYEIRALDDVGNLFAAFLGGVLAHVGVCARAQAFGQFVANLHLGGRFAEGQRLLIGIDGNEIDALQAGINHAIDRIGAGAAHANDFDGGKVVVIHFKFEHKASPR